MDKPIVIDNGTGYTKMGYAGNLDPDYVFPTAIADVFKKGNVVTSRGNDEYNYAIGDEAIKLARFSNKHSLTYPMRNGIIDNWDLMEKFWNQSLYNYLKCDPQEHYILLTEPPMNPPENRENIAEIFFETFNVPGLYIGVQATLALIGCNQSQAGLDLTDDQRSAIKSHTGIVVDSGDGVTHVVPICDGYVIGSGIKHIPIAGRKITTFISDMIRDRGEPIHPEDLKFVSMEIKEKYGYLCKDLVEELSKFDQKNFNEVNKTYSLSSKYKKYSGIGQLTNKPINIDLGYEIFMGPEAFFSPEIIDKDYKNPIDELIDMTVQHAPIDYRRKLYSNIVLSGGSTMFKNFDKRLQKATQKRVNERLDGISKKFGHKPNPIVVNVAKNLIQPHCVWLGGSIFASKPNFQNVVHTREEYLEKGASCCRYNQVFNFE